ncbi:MAG: alkane 1-monooxygenase [Bacteroidota bacterium]
MWSYRLSALKYLSVLSLPLTVVLAFSLQGYWVWLPLVYTFGMIPLLELMVGAGGGNLEAAEEELVRKDPFYDWLLYLFVPLQYVFLGWFLWLIANGEFTGWEHYGLILSMGLMCGTIGINLGHELGHRVKKNERRLAKVLLLSSLYMHFYIEHNRGHHKRVATEEDPATSRRGENVYRFWLRSIWFSYKSAWDLEADRLRKRRLPFWSHHNEMLMFQVIQLGFLAAIWLAFGWVAMLSFIAAAIIGIQLLETVNYIEHYGLAREEIAENKFERVQPHHSWNSNHIIGRMLLFELSRHSDHHFMASRKYQILRHFEDAPQMPTGYPGMMILSLIPPLWFRVMHQEIEKVENRQHMIAPV